MNKVYMYRVNGKGKNGTNFPPRFVIERNVLDLLEDNDYYGNLSFCDAQIVVEMATMAELMAIYQYKLDPSKIPEILLRD